jgi:hypothetical protein
MLSLAGLHSWIQLLKTRLHSFLFFRNNITWSIYMLLFIYLSFVWPDQLVN